MRIRRSLGKALTQLQKNWPIKILSLAAAVLLFLLNAVVGLEERYVNVPIELELPGNLVPNSSYANNARVGVRGEPDDIWTIAENDIEVFVDFSGVTAEGVYRRPVEYRATAAIRDVDPLEINIEPEEITVSLEEKLGRNVPVAPQIAGTPPEGYLLENWVTTPDSVLLEGPRSLVEPIEQLVTEEVDISNRRDDFSLRLRLVTPDPLVNVPGGEFVDFTARIEERIVTRTFEDVPVVVAGLRDDLRPSAPLPRGFVQIQGRELAVEEILSDEVLLIVDATDVEQAGAVTIPVRASLPQEIKVVTYDPRQVELVIEDAPQGPSPGADTSPDNGPAAENEPGADNEAVAEPTADTEAAADGTGESTAGGGPGADEAAP